MAKAIPVFLGNLFEVASDPTNTTSVIITLAATTNAFGAETTEITDLLDDSQSAANDAVAETGDVLTRAVQPSAVIKPADDNEIGEILKKRLFAIVDESRGRAAGDAYRDFYEALPRPSSWPAEPNTRPPTETRSPRPTPSTRNSSASSTSGLGNITQFQRARGALKLLAEVVANI